jgi:hypothetical protein
MDRDALRFWLCLSVTVIVCALSLVIFVVRMVR